MKTGSNQSLVIFAIIYSIFCRKMVCIAGADFYNALTNEKQKTTFVETFTKVKDQPDTPFNDLLLSL